MKTRFDDDGTGMLQESLLVRKFMSCGYEEQQSKRRSPGNLL